MQPCHLSGSSSLDAENSIVDNAYLRSHRSDHGAVVLKDNQFSSTRTVLSCQRADSHDREQHGSRPWRRSQPGLSCHTPRPWTPLCSAETRHREVRPSSASSARSHRAGHFPPRGTMADPRIRQLQSRIAGRARGRHSHDCAGCHHQGEPANLFGRPHRRRRHPGRRGHGQQSGHLHLFQ